jgi:hypothetical protein
MSVCLSVRLVRRGPACQDEGEGVSNIWEGRGVGDNAVRTHDASYN